MATPLSPSIPPTPPAGRVGDSVYLLGPAGGQRPVSFSIGEVLEAVVRERFADNRVLVGLKDATLIADIEGPLADEKTLRVRVERLQPQVLLRVLKAPSDEMQRIGEYVRFQRAQPDALLKFLSTAATLLTSPDMEAAVADREMFQQILRALQSLLISREMVRNPSFVKEFLSQLGIFFEKDLEKAFLEKKPPQEGTLKGLLLKLAASLQDPSGSLPSTESTRRLSELVEKGINAIEAQQVVNVLLQESNQTFMLQIPLLFPQGLRMQEVYIEGDREPSAEQDEQRRYRIVFFLDMTAIGTLMVDAGVKGQTVSCALRSEDAAVCDFINPLLTALQDRFLALGYDVAYLGCYPDNNLALTRDRYRQGLALYEQDAVNVFA
jgi:hypothetical protein